MRTFKYTYVDAKGNPKESTVEADDKNDAYIILKTMRINPDSITETESEDISFEVIGEKEPEKVVPPTPVVRRPSWRKGTGEGRAPQADRPDAFASNGTDDPDG